MKVRDYFFRATWEITGEIRRVELRWQRTEIQVVGASSDTRTRWKRETVSHPRLSSTCGIENRERVCNNYFAASIHRRLFTDRRMNSSVESLIGSPVVYVYTPFVRYSRQPRKLNLVKCYWRLLTPIYMAGRRNTSLTFSFDYLIVKNLSSFTRRNTGSILRIEFLEVSLNLRSLLRLNSRSRSASSFNDLPRASSLIDLKFDLKAELKYYCSSNSTLVFEL